MKSYHEEKFIYSILKTDIHVRGRLKSHFQGACVTFRLVMLNFGAFFSTKIE